MYVWSGPLQKSLPAPDCSTHEPVSTVGIFLSRIKLGEILIEKSKRKCQIGHSFVVVTWLLLLFRKAKSTAEAHKFWINVVLSSNLVFSDVASTMAWIQKAHVLKAWSPADVALLTLTHGGANLNNGLIIDEVILPALSGSGDWLKNIETHLGEHVLPMTIPVSVSASCPSWGATPISFLLHTLVFASSCTGFRSIGTKWPWPRAPNLWAELKLSCRTLLSCVCYHCEEPLTKTVFFGPYYIWGSFFICKGAVRSAP